jgi:type II secretory pathway component PulF
MKPTKIRLRSKDQLILFTDLATMLSAGIPLLEAVESLEPDAKGNLKKVLAELHHSLLNGETLSHAMEHFPKSFDPITINLMKAAEAGGTLEETLHDIVRTIKKEVEFTGSMKIAMIYPAFVMLIFSGILIMMLTFVVPRVSQVFHALRTPVPWTTRTLIHASDFFMHHWPFIISGIILFVVLVAVFVSSHKRAVAQLLLSLPGLRKLGTSIDLARLTRTLSLLLHAGVPLDETLLLARHSVRKKNSIAVIRIMQRNMNAGRPLASGLRNIKGGIPAVFARSLETAERTGTLEKTLQNLSKHFDAQVGESLKAISSLIEPLMIVIVGGLVGGLIITVMAPIYSVTSHLQVKK